MSRSRHTLPPRVYAERVGEFQVARVIERRPRPGDIHPIPKDWVEGLLMLVPLEYVVGLRRVELRAREGDVGRPYATYWPDERAIVVYSVPRTWECRYLADYERRSMRRYGATVGRANSGWRVYWGERSELEQWFAFIVLFHELGHHVDRQYRRRRGRVRGRSYKESFADRTGIRIFRGLWREIDRRQKARAAEA
jgi:hypothetical protein